MSVSAKGRYRGFTCRNKRKEASRSNSLIHTCAYSSNALHSIDQCSHSPSNSFRQSKPLYPASCSKVRGIDLRLHIHIFTRVPLIRYQFLYSCLQFPCPSGKLLQSLYPQYPIHAQWTQQSGTGAYQVAPVFQERNVILRNPNDNLSLCPSLFPTNPHISCSYYSRAKQCLFAKKKEPFSEISA